MRPLYAFAKKELTEQARSGKFIILSAIFVVMGIMNPAVAKITPWLIEALSDSMLESGMIITVTEVNALDSWIQFFKNAPMLLIAFTLVESNMFTKEYQSGTLLLTLTKGIARYKIVIANTMILLLLWSLGYWASFGITYAYNSYFWDNSVAQNLGASAFFWWLFGAFVVMLMVSFSVLFSSNTAVLLSTGATVLVFYLFSLIPKINKYVPIKLTDGNSLIFGTADSDSYLAACIITAVICVFALAASIPIFNRKQL
jgi:ABC-2 type transport system permease protein